MDQDSWGLDHGTWSVLAHVFPKADIPVVQLSIHAGEEFSYHVDLGARLAPLRERGIFIIGSGNVVHNLRQIDWHAPDSAYDWAEEFDQEVKHIMTTKPSDLPSIAAHPAFRMAVPTPEHFLPLAYLAGIAVAAGEVTDVLVEGGSMGSITMTSFLLGCQPIRGANAVVNSAASIPDPVKIPPESTNI
jgi:4,5-DOPA dioxygenase extradiol